MLPDAHWLARAHSAANARYPDQPTTLELLPPHGSLRRYVRVQRPLATTERSAILMLLPPQDAVSPEGGISLDYPLEDSPFLAVGHWLSDAGVRVPTIYDTHAPTRAIWLEDLGADHMDDALQKGRLSMRDAYFSALDLLEDFRRAPLHSHPPKRCTQRSLDADILLWELRHYIEWRLKNRLGITLSKAQSRAVEGSFDWIVRALTQLPQTIVHRDFQSRNIMCCENDAFALIDFQDSLMGPVPYDAVALLRDSYISLPDDLLQAILHQWATRTADDARYARTPDAFIRGFHIQTIQRKLKDSGRFDFFDLKQGKAGFLQYRPASMRYVHEAFVALDAPALAPLQEVLAAHDPLFKA